MAAYVLADITILDPTCTRTIAAKCWLSLRSMAAATWCAVARLRCSRETGNQIA